MSKVGDATAFVEGQSVLIDQRDGVTFQVGPDDEKVTVRFVHGELVAHSHAWGKRLGAIGEAGNVLRLVVIGR